jgi:hypothetical protein
MREQRTRSAGMTSSRAKITLRRKPRQGSNSTCHATLRSDAYYFVVPSALALTALAPHRAPFSLAQRKEMFSPMA